MQEKRSCRTCVWRLSNSGNSKEYHCGYSLCLTHHSRIWLHYQRTGRESLEGMTFDTNCTEWMHGNPRAKLSLLQDNPGAVTAEAWALLAQEMGKPVKPEKLSRKPYALTADLDMDKAYALKREHTWIEISNASGLSLNGAKGSWQRHRINRQAAKRLLDAYGVDITKGGI